MQAADAIPMQDLPLHLPPKPYYQSQPRGAHSGVPSAQSIPPPYKRNNLEVPSSNSTSSWQNGYLPPLPSPSVGSQSFGSPFAQASPSFSGEHYANGERRMSDSSDDGTALPHARPRLPSLTRSVSDNGIEDQTTLHNGQRLQVPSNTMPKFGPPRDNPASKRRRTESHDTDSLPTPGRTVVPDLAYDFDDWFSVWPVPPNPLAFLEDMGPSQFPQYSAISSSQDSSPLKSTFSGNDEPMCPAEFATFSYAQPSESTPKIACAAEPATKRSKPKAAAAKKRTIAVSRKEDTAAMMEKARPAFQEIVESLQAIQDKIHELPSRGPEWHGVATELENVGREIKRKLEQSEAPIERVVVAKKKAVGKSAAKARSKKDIRVEKSVEESEDDSSLDETCRRLEMELQD